MIIHNPILTGSFTVNGTDVSSITSSAASLTSLNAYTASQNNRNGTYATTGSNTFAGIQTVNSNLVVTGSITAQTLVVQTITSSVDFVTGSTQFGSILSNTHVFSGSVTMNPGGLFVSSSGNVGIGTTSPLDQFDVYRSAPGSAAWSTRAVARDNSRAAFTGVYWNGSASRPGVFAHTSALNGWSTLWLNTIDGTVNNSGDVIIGGNVGLGTTSPLGSSTERTLHLSDGGAGFTTLYVTNGANTLRGIFAVSNSPSTISIGTQTNTDLRIVTNDTPRMTITSGGLVGINTSSPFNFGTNSGMLDVRSQNTSAVAGVFVSNSDATARLTMYINNAATATIGTSTSHAVQFVTNDTEKMRITPNGEVGIGATPTSGNRFWVRGSSTSGSDTAIFVQNSTPSTLFSVRNDGIVTKPLQPAFRAGRSTSYSPGALTTIVFNSTGGFGFNVGGHYNTSNGRFTAPISGIYNFTACVIWESVSNGQAMDDGFELKVNGTTAAYSFRRAAYVANTTGIGGYYVDNVTALLNLTAGQYVEIMNRYNLTVHGNANYCYFNGYLVG